MVVLTIFELPFCDFRTFCETKQIQDGGSSIVRASTQTKLLGNAALCSWLKIVEPSLKRSTNVSENV